MIGEEDKGGGRVELRIKVGDHEVEIKGGKEEVSDLLEKAIRYVSTVSKESPGDILSGEGREEVLGEIPPSIEITPRDTVTSILEKLFSSKWSSKPRTLREVIDTLSSIGLHYPKSTVAVSLTRLVKRNVIRRMKTKEKVYVYLPASPLI
jgi:hypothetical protein